MNSIANYKITIRAAEPDDTELPYWQSVAVIEGQDDAGHQIVLAIDLNTQARVYTESKIVAAILDDYEQILRQSVAVLALETGR